MTKTAQDDEVAKQSHLASRIPRSKYLSFHMVSDPESPYVFMMPSADYFSEVMKSLDIRKSDTIVCYDSQNMFVSARISWMLRTMGAPYVSVLNGTFSKWEAEKRPLKEGN